MIAGATVDVYVAVLNTSQGAIIFKVPIVKDTELTVTGMSRRMLQKRRSHDRENV